MNGLASDIIQVRHKAGSYPVIIKAGLLDEIGSSLTHLTRSHVIVISDHKVWAALGERLSQGLISAGIRLVPIVLPPGEQTKRWSDLIGLIDRLIELGVERSDTLLAFGGGVVGDLAGFAAAILKRGCRYIQVPTSLLAQVDSSVGGKTGINTIAGKNLVGAFHAPEAVFIDPTALDSLTERHLRAGYAEIVKYGLISDPDFFAWCERLGPALLAGDIDHRAHAIGASVGAKAEIVGKDERETGGARALLNFGHTFGHALEAEAGMNEKLLHGEAVSIGMSLAYRFSAKRGFCAPDDVERVTSHLRGCGLPTGLSEIGIYLEAKRLAEHMRHDKKQHGGRRSRLILTRGIGKAFIEDNVEFDEISSFLDRELEQSTLDHAALR